MDAFNLCTAILAVFSIPYGGWLVQQGHFKTARYVFQFAIVITLFGCLGGLYGQMMAKELTVAKVLGIAAFAAILIFFSGYGMLVNQQEESKVASPKKLPELPHIGFTARLYQFRTGHALNNGKPSVNVCLQVTITCTGAPSILRDYKLSVENKNVLHKGKWMYLPGTVELIPKSGSAGPALQFPPSEYLHEKTSTVPLQKGEARGGWLIFNFAAVSESDLENGRWTLEANDYLDKPHVLYSDYIDRNNEIGGYIRMPGSATELTPKKAARNEPANDESSVDRSPSMGVIVGYPRNIATNVSPFFAPGGYRNDLSAPNSPLFIVVPTGVKNAEVQILMRNDEPSPLKNVRVAVDQQVKGFPKLPVPPWNAESLVPDTILEPAGKPMDVPLWEHRPANLPVDSHSPDDHSPKTFQFDVPVQGRFTAVHLTFTVSSDGFSQPFIARNMIMICSDSDAYKEGVERGPNDPPKILVRLLSLIVQSVPGVTVKLSNDTDGAAYRKDLRDALLRGGWKVDDIPGDSYPRSHLAVLVHDGLRVFSNAKIAGETLVNQLRIFGVLASLKDDPTLPDNTLRIEMGL